MDVVYLRGWAAQIGTLPYRLGRGEVVNYLIESVVMS